jgi:hypothetical protein
VEKLIHIHTLTGFVSFTLLAWNPTTTMMVIYPLDPNHQYPASPRGEMEDDVFSSLGAPNLDNEAVGDEDSAAEV